MFDARSTLDRLIRQNRDDYSALSRMIGRNPAYIQQFIKRGSPKRLGETERRILARYFQIDEVRLGGPAQHSPHTVELAFYPVREGQCSSDSNLLTFDANWLKSITKSNPNDLRLVRSTGDTMSPVVCNADIVIVDMSESPRRDGIYALESNGAVFFRRMVIQPNKSALTLLCDNNLYPIWENVDLTALSIIGRAIWISRKVL